MTEVDVHSWQRLAPMSLLFLVINGGARLIRENLYAFAGAGAGFAFLDRLGLREFALGGLVFLLAGVLVALLYYRRFRFRIEGDAMRVRRGLIESKDLRVRFARVQNVGLSEPFYFRPFGLVRFTLETPGAETTEVALPGISRSLAYELRDRIARAGVGEAAGVEDDTIEAQEDGSDLIHDPSAARLFAHGLVSNQVWLIAGLAAWAGGALWERIEGWIGSTGVDVVLSRVLALGWVGAAVLITGLVLLLFVLSGVISLVRFQDFVLRDLGDRLLSQGGMLDKREQTIRREKLTGMTLYQTALGRVLGQWYLVGKQAGSSEFEIDPKGQHFLVPGLTGSDLAVVGRLIPGFTLPSRFEPISRRFRRFFFTRSALAIAAVAGLVAWQHPDGVAWIGGVAAAVAAAAGVMIHRTWRCWGWQVERGVCWVQQGLIGFRRDAFRLDLVQQAVFLQTPYQRRHGLGSVRFVLPHGQVTVPFIDEADAAALLNRGLFEAETALAHRI